MRRCDKCGVEFTGDLDVCPLCQARLTGEASPSVFPRNEVKKSGTMALRVLAFVTGVGVLTTLFVGQMLGLAGSITMPICVAQLVNYALVRHALVSAPDFLVLLALAVVWFAVGRNPVVATYVVPSICLAALVFDAVLVCVFRGTFVSGYAKYLLLDVVFGLVPLLFVALGFTTWDVLAYVSALVACVLLLGLVVFARERLAAEVRKLFMA